MTTETSDILHVIQHSIVAGSLAGCAVDFTLYPVDTIKTRLQQSRQARPRLLFSSLYSGIGSVLVGSAPSSALFFTAYNLTKHQLNLSREWQVHMIAAAIGEMSACLVRVPVEIIKQRAQVDRTHRLSAIARSSFANEGFRGLYRGYLATVSREIPFSVIQFPLWEYFKRRWSERQGYAVAPWQGALCGSLAGGISACLTTPLDVAKTRIMLAHHLHTDAGSHSLQILRNIAKNEGFTKLYRGVVPRTLWMSLGGLIFFGAFEFATSLFFFTTNN